MKDRTMAIVVTVIISAIVAAWYVSRAPATISTTNAHGASPVVNVSMISIATSTDYITITGSYPHFSDASDDFNESISQLVHRLAFESEVDSHRNWRARVDTDPSSSTPAAPPQDQRMSLDVAPSIIRNDSALISLKLDVSSYTGGAHGAHDIYTFNYDKRTKAPITLDAAVHGDSQFLQKLSVIARDRLAHMIAEEGSTTVDQVDKDMLDQGTTPTKENYSLFTIPNDHQLTFYFGEYQVAAYVFGVQELTVDIPLSK